MENIINIVNENGYLSTCVLRLVIHGSGRKYAHVEHVFLVVHHVVLRLAYIAVVTPF